MPDVFDELETEPTPKKDIFDDLEDVVPTPEKPPARVSTGALGTRFRPSKTNPFAGPPDQSAFGISPEMVPSGANTRVPWLTIPASVIGKTAAGIGGYLTSPQGMIETSLAATPAAPAIFAKWAYDMARGGYKSVQAIVNEVGGMARDAFNQGIIDANQLGPAPEVTTMQDHVQSIAENAANAAIMAMGGLGAGAHAVNLTKGLVKGKTVPTPEVVSEKAPPAAVTGEAQPSEAPVGAGTEGAAVTAPTPQPLPETKPVETATQAETVTTPVTDIGPGTIGQAEMGAAGKEEIPETGAGGEKYGVAQRIREERAQAGQVAPVEPGQGMSTQQTIAMGRDIVRRDPEAGPRILAAFEADPDKKISTEGIAVARAHGESLAAGARTIEENYGTESPEYRAAKEVLSDWDRRIKAMQTEWHKQGQAQQGETDIDTASFTGLNRGYEQNSKKQIPKQFKPKAEKIAAENKQAQQSVNQASTELNDAILKKAGGSTDADKAAIDAANKTVTEAAARMAEAENKSRVAEEERKQAVEESRKLSEPQSSSVIISEAIKRAREDSERRIKAATSKSESSKAQLDAAQRALKSAEDVVRRSAVEASKESSRVKSSGSDDAQSLAAKRALDAAQRSVRENALTVARLENESRVSEEDLKNELKSVQDNRERIARELAHDASRKDAINKARAENKARIEKAKRDKETADVQAKAAKKALDAAQEVERKVRERAIKEAQRRASDPSIAVWEKAKEILDENKGLYSFDDLRNKLAAEMNMPTSKVVSILAQDPAVKRLTSDVLVKQRNARRLKEQAKIWLRELDTPGYQKALASIPDAMFSLSVFGHGFVALGTHAPIVAFQPRFWNAYVRNFGKMYHMVFSPAYYEMQMQDLVRRPNYDIANDAGLQNDPFKYEAFHTTMVRDLVKNWLGEKGMDRVDKIASAGNRGYGVLKLLRQDMFDQAYDRLPRNIRVQEGVASALSDGINHATGVTQKQGFKGSNILLFAPRLAASRVMWVGGDPIRAGAAILNWKNASTADKLFAQNQMREKAWVFGTFASLLAINQGFLKASGSDQKINGIPEALGGAGFDPLAGDFLKFKVHGANIAYGGALLTLCKMPVRVGYAIAYEGKGSKYVLEEERVDKVVLGYLRTQASPFMGSAVDLALGRDFEQRPLPAKLFGTMEQTGAVPKRLVQQGVDEPYGWLEYAGTKLPIPVAEALKEGLKGSGVPDEQLSYWTKAFGIGIIMTGTGTRITEDTREE